MHMRFTTENVPVGIAGGDSRQCHRHADSETQRGE
jgi:hypothetical protein